MAASIELNRRLRWADADAAGRLHFPRIFELVEEAESELVRAIGWPMSRLMGHDFPAGESGVPISQSVVAGRSVPAHAYRR